MLLVIIAVPLIIAYVLFFFYTKNLFLANIRKKTAQNKCGDFYGVSLYSYTFGCINAFSFFDNENGGIQADK